MLAPCHPDRKIHSRGLCQSCYNKQHRKNNPDILSATDRRAHLKSRYGITAEDYSQMVDDRDSKCDICGVTTEKLVVDHEHTTNAIRGLLCNACNAGLGMFYDDQQRLQQAIRYLSRG